MAELRPERFGRYLLIDKISSGGMAEVFLAKSAGAAGFEKVLAIKRILPVVAEDSDFRAMFADEAQISARLNHPHIGQVLEFGEIGETYFISMEFVPGQDLRGLRVRLDQSKRFMPVNMAMFIASRVCQGLDYAHRQTYDDGRSMEIIHRDVSPPNVLVSYEGAVKLIDFGIARAASRVTRTRAGKLKGKFAYMSPEQIDAVDIDHRSDVFSLGIVFYEMLTNRRPFEGKTQLETLNAVRRDEPPPPSTINTEVPLEVDRIVLKALAKKPVERYAWASELRADIERFFARTDATFGQQQLAGWMRASFADAIEEHKQLMKRVGTLRVEDFEEPEPVMPRFEAPRPAPPRVVTGEVTSTPGLRGAFTSDGAFTRDGAFTSDDAFDDEPTAGAPAHLIAAAQAGAAAAATRDWVAPMDIAPSDLEALDDGDDELTNRGGGDAGAELDEPTSDDVAAVVTTDEPDDAEPTLAEPSARMMPSKAGANEDVLATAATELGELRSTDVASADLGTAPWTAPPPDTEATPALPELAAGDAESFDVEEDPGQPTQLQQHPHFAQPHRGIGGAADAGGLAAAADDEDEELTNAVGAEDSFGEEDSQVATRIEAAPAGLQDADRPAGTPPGAPPSAPPKPGDSIDRLPVRGSPVDARSVASEGAVRSTHGGEIKPGSRETLGPFVDDGPSVIAPGAFTVPDGVTAEEIYPPGALAADGAALGAPPGAAAGGGGGVAGVLRKLSSTQLIVLVAAATLVVVGVIVLAVAVGGKDDGDPGAGGGAISDRGNTGSLVITTRPAADCSLTIDKVKRLLPAGRSVSVPRLKAGVHTLTLNCAGFKLHERTATIRATQVTFVEAKLSRQ